MKALFATLALISITPSAWAASPMRFDCQADGHPMDKMRLTLTDETAQCEMLDPSGATRSSQKFALSHRLESSSYFTGPTGYLIVDENLPNPGVNSSIPGGSVKLNDVFYRCSSAN